MSEGISIIEDKDRELIIIKNDFLDVEIPTVDFFLITTLFLQGESTMFELCRCYQEQF